MADITKDEIRQPWLELMNEFSDSLEQEEGARGADIIHDGDLDGVNNPLAKTLSLPGVVYDMDPLLHPEAQAQKYVQLPYSVLDDQFQKMKEQTLLCKEATDDTVDAIARTTEIANEWSDPDGYKNQIIAYLSSMKQIWDEWFGVGAYQDSGLEQEMTNAVSDATQAASDANSAASVASQKAAAAQSAADNANTAATAANTAANTANTATQRCENAIAGAENVDAELSGMTITITNRNGVSSSVNIGFEIAEEHVYPSKAAMRADAGQVQAGQFCMIASNDPLDKDNATLWSRNTLPADVQDPEFPYTFLSDLDQASSSAFEEWLNNYKPQIEADHTQAGLDHTTMSQDHTIAEGDHARAEEDHARVSVIATEESVRNIVKNYF